MAEYFYKSEEAEDYIKRTSYPVALYARIELHGAQQWMVDHQDRGRGSSIHVLEDLTHNVPAIRKK